MTENAITKREPQAPTRPERAQQTPVFVPRVDIRESAAEVVLVADLPGVDETTVSIDLEGSEQVRGDAGAFEFFNRVAEQGDESRLVAQCRIMDHLAAFAQVIHNIAQKTNPHGISQ